MMESERKSPVLSILAVVVLLLLPLGAYVGGYFWLGEAATIPFTTASGGAQPGMERKYGRDWLRGCFEPAAWAEAKLGGYPVLVLGKEDAKAFSP